MAAELEVPQHLYVHGFLLMHGEKMSKSWATCSTRTVIERFGADALRFYCFREVTFGQDGRSPPRASRRATRPSWQTTRQPRQPHARDGRALPRRRVPTWRPTRAGGRLRRAADTVAALLDRAEISQALEEIWQRVRRLNRYVEERAPWQLAKDPAQAGELDATLPRSPRACAP